MTAPGPSAHDARTRFRRTLIRVMTMQVGALLVLWALQAAFNR